MKKVFIINFCLIVLLLILILSLILIKTNNQQIIYQQDQEVQKIQDFISQTQYDACYALKISGQEPPAFGVAINDKQLISYADWNSNYQLDQSEELNQLFLNQNFYYQIETDNLIFLKKKFIDGVCVNQVCQGEDNIAIMTMGDMESNFIKQLYINQKTGNLAVK